MKLCCLTTLYKVNCEMSMENGHPFWFVYSEFVSYFISPSGS